LVSRERRWRERRAALRALEGRCGRDGSKERYLLAVVERSWQASLVPRFE
jgi:hypothetical protein